MVTKVNFSVMVEKFRDANNLLFFRNNYLLSLLPIYRLKTMICTCSKMHICIGHIITD